MFSNQQHLYIQNETQFESIALETFHYQYKHCLVYQNYCNHLLKKIPEKLTEIPFLPISFFKTHRVISSEFTQEQILFQSSGTTSDSRSKHYIADISFYEASFLTAYYQLIGKPEEHTIIALLPNYLEQGDSSLVYMVNKLIEETKSDLSCFIHSETQQVESLYQRALEMGRKPVIIGVSYTLLDLAEKNINLSQSILIETGGMKGRRKEMSKQQLHEILKEQFQIGTISSEYGMTELLSQAYSFQDGIFLCPPWMKVLIRDTNDPFTYLPDAKTGGLNIIDLANKYSCSFIATQDLGKTMGNKFELMGRFDFSDIRGCNLLVQ